MTLPAGSPSLARPPIVGEVVTPFIRPASPLLSVPGTVAGDGIDAGVAGHYGDPLLEQRRILRGEPVIVDRSHRDVVTVTGPDRLSWLHSLISQHVSGLMPGETREGLLLSPHGHVEQHLVITDDATTSWIDLEPGRGPEFVAWLDSMRFMLRVEVNDVSDAIGILSVVNETAVPDVPAVVSRVMPWGRDLLVERSSFAAAAGAVEGSLAGHLAFEAIRVEARRPRFGFETDHRTIPHEVGWLETAVHLDKGCYRGQETVARVHNLGRPPRRLVMVHFDGSRETLPVAGEDGSRPAITLDDRVVGFLGTTAWHAELGPIGLAVIKRQVPDDAQLICEGLAVAIDG